MGKVTEVTEVTEETTDILDVPIIEEIKETDKETDKETEKESEEVRTPRMLTPEERRKFLKGKLRQKISGKRTNRTVGLNRKKSEDLNDSMKKITEVLANQNINSPDQIDSNVLETVMNILNKQDLELLIDKLKDNTVFKEVLNKLQDKYSE